MWEIPVDNYSFLLYMIIFLVKSYFQKIMQAQQKQNCQIFNLSLQVRRMADKSYQIILVQMTNIVFLVVMSGKGQLSL